jgi:hypothetical protein
LFEIGAKMLGGIKSEHNAFKENIPRKDRGINVNDISGAKAGNSQNRSFQNAANSIMTDNTRMTAAGRIKNQVTTAPGLNEIFKMGNQY